MPPTFTDMTPAEAAKSDRHPPVAPAADAKRNASPRSDMPVAASAPPPATAEGDHKSSPVRFAALALGLAAVCGGLPFESGGPRPVAGGPSEAGPARTVALESRAAPPVAVDIERVRLGSLVRTGTPHGDRDGRFGPVDPPSWRRVTLLAPKADGTFSTVALLRPLSWCEAHAVEFWGTVHAAVPEIGIDGESLVLAVGPCPPVENLNPDGSVPDGYAVVTGTFRHQAAEVYDLRVEGEPGPLGTTGNHPFWSEDRQDYVRAEDLRVGERLLNAEDEAVRVTAVSPRGPPGATEEVFNLEVHGEHVYRVGAGGVLVHNACVYWEMGPNGIPRYIGITNNFSRRFREHARNGRPIQLIQNIPGNLAHSLSRQQARAIEQHLINKFGLPNLANKINSIARSNTQYSTLLQWARTYLPPGLR